MLRLFGRKSIPVDIPEKYSDSFLDDYHISKIGKGQFGKVYRLENKIDPNKVYAGKLIPITKKDAKFIRDEIQYLKLLTLSSNPDSLNLATYYSSIKLEDNIMILMLYCEGGDLFNYIERMRSKSNIIDNLDLQMIMWQLMKGIKFMHKKGVIHRDLKPENIFLREENSLKDIRIGDFGLSIKKKCGSVYKLYKTGSAMYMAPEVVRGRYGCECDLWSLGVIMFFLMTYEFPFHHSIYTFQMSGKQKIVYDFDNEWVDNIYFRQYPNVAQKVVINLLEPNPLKRWTANQVLDSAWLSGFDIKLLNKIE